MATCEAQELGMGTSCKATKATRASMLRLDSVGMVVWYCAWLAYLRRSAATLAPMLSRLLVGWGTAAPICCGVVTWYTRHTHPHGQARTHVMLCHANLPHDVSTTTEQQHAVRTPIVPVSVCTRPWAWM